MTAFPANICDKRERERMSAYRVGMKAQAPKAQGHAVDTVSAADGNYCISTATSSIPRAFLNLNQYQLERKAGMAHAHRRFLVFPRTNLVH